MMDKQQYFKELSKWREWLDANHANEQVVWLIYYKKHTGIASIDYVESVEEGLCYGWIDGLVKRLDDERYMRRFTPRRKGSVWAPSNLARIKKLLQEGRMKPAGLESIKGLELDSPAPESPVNED